MGLDIRSTDRHTMVSKLRSDDRAQCKSLDERYVGRPDLPENDDIAEEEFAMTLDHVDERTIEARRKARLEAEGVREDGFTEAEARYLGLDDYPTPEDNLRIHEEDEPRFKLINHIMREQRSALR